MKKHKKSNKLRLFIEMCLKMNEMKRKSDAADIELFDLDQLPELAFDHNKIIEDAKKDIEFIELKEE